jgi:hypothetical protein
MDSGPSLTGALPVRVVAMRVGEESEGDRDEIGCDFLRRVEDVDRTPECESRVSRALARL